MFWYSLLKFLHILSAILFAGGIFSRQLVRQQTKKTQDVNVFSSLSQAAGQIERILIVPGSTATLIIGVILALIAGQPIFGILQGASQNWLLVSNILLLIMIIIIPTVFVKRGKKYEPILQTALAQGQITSELRAAMDDRVVMLGHLYEEVAIILIAALMVLKPF